MAIKILTVEEAEATKKMCELHGEYFYGIRGTALHNYLCDNSNDAIPLGNECVACVVLPFKNNPNRAHQEEMLTSYIRPL